MTQPDLNIFGGMLPPDTPQFSPSKRVGALVLVETLGVGETTSSFGVKMTARANVKIVSDPNDHVADGTYFAGTNIYGVGLVPQCAQMVGRTMFGRLAALQSKHPNPVVKLVAPTQDDWQTLRALCEVDVVARRMVETPGQAPTSPQNGQGQPQPASQPSSYPQTATARPTASEAPPARLRG